jgi:SsrA-binding protein
MARKKPKQPDNTIAVNKKARHDYFFEEDYEAGLVLEGWEVKSLRDGRLQLKESYVQLKGGEAFLTGAHISPLESASTHVQPNPIRPRKLLLNRSEISRLIGAVERKGYTLVPLSMYWIRGRAKLKVGLGRGKKTYDKRATDKDRDWARDKQRLLRAR